MLKFDQKDIVEGECYETKRLKKLGEQITKQSFYDDDKEVVVEANKVHQVGFNHPSYTEHKTTLLETAVLPPKLVEEWEINHVDRRYFRGETAIRNVERVLNIDCGLQARYRFGYQNNHARHDDNRRNNS